MSEYTKIYETSAINTGGRDGVSYLSDGSYEVKIATPKKLGGTGKGQNPEQLFALGYAACFHGALELVKGQHKVKNNSQVSQVVSLWKKPDAADFKLEVAIEVGIQDVSLEETQKFAEAAHAICPYSKALEGNITIFVRATDYDASKEK
ncbi:organic hydroperoxide resistance protein [Enterococcus saccharolyticus]|uniref:organic hydroperoxide resistance protein n=1 Tax=Enterococcus saccharolyticus TaxID=41997 RepID=UPI0039E0B125